MPATYVGTIGPQPVPATHIVVTDDIDPSLNGLISQAAAQLGISPRNFRRDYLEPARPVFHLIQALFQTMSSLKADDGEALMRHLSPRRLLLQPEWVRQAVQDANRTREWWPAEQKLFPALGAINPAGFVRLTADR